MTSFQRISSLIVTLYDCVLDPAKWEGLLSDLCTELHFANAVLAANALPSGATSIFVSVGITPAWLARINDHAAEVLRLWGGPDRIQTYSLDEPIVQSHATNRSMWKGNRFFEDWATPQGLFDAVSIPFARDPTMVGNVTLGRHRGAGDIGEAELAPLRLIAPHVRRAMTISRLLDLQTIAASTFASALETVRVAVVLVDDDLGVVHMNSAAGSMLAASDPVRTQNGRAAVHVAGHD